MITIYEKTRTSGYQSPVFGFMPARKTRYIMDIQCGSGTRIGIGGVSVSLGSGRQTVVVDSDASLQKAFVSINGGTPYEVSYIYLYQNDAGVLFTPYSATISPSGTVHVYSIKQQVEDKGLVTAIGSNKYQAIGYDGPHEPSYTRLSMEDIKNAGMTATLFADIDYIGSQLSYLRDLVDNYGWDLGIHFSFYNGDTWLWADAQAQMWVEYDSIKNSFGGITPTCWCILGIGAYSDLYKNAWVWANMGMFRRSWRIAAQYIVSGVGLYDTNYTQYKEAWDQGYAEVPVYMHQTDGGGGSGQLSRTNWLLCFNSIVANGVKLTGYADVYYMLKNQEDAIFATSYDGTDLLITPITNGYPAMIVVKVDAGTVTGVTEGGLPVEYSVTPENYISFLVEHNKTYIVSLWALPLQYSSFPIPVDAEINGVIYPSPSTIPIEAGTTVTIKVPREVRTQ